MNTSKILFAGDTHGNLSHLRYLIKVAGWEGLDRIVVLGDFGYWEHTEEGVQFLDKLNTLLQESNVHLFFVDGNHDNVDLLREKYPHGATLDTGSLRYGFATPVRERIWYLPRGLRWTWHGARFIALGGAYSVDKQWRVDAEKKKGKPGTLWFPGEQMTDMDMARILAEDNGPVDIMLAHDKPMASDPGWNTKVLAQCIPNQERLQVAVETLTPRLFLHGHLHVRYEEMIPLPGDMDVGCRVVGLGADPEASWMPRYSAKDSWIIVDLKEYAHVS